MDQKTENNAPQSGSAKLGAVVLISLVFIALIACFFSYRAGYYGGYIDGIEHTVENFDKIIERP